MNVLVYGEGYQIFKAHYINTINHTKGFLKNNCIVYFYVNNIIWSKNDEIIKIYNLQEYINKKKLIFFTSLNYNDVLKYIIKNDINLVYARNFKLPALLYDNNILRNKIYCESHGDFPPNEIKRYFDKITYVTISNILKKNWGFINTIVFPCSIDFDFFNTISKIEKNNNFTITYGGHIYPYKGIPLLIESAKIMKNINFNIIGGAEKDKLIYKDYTSNVKFITHKTQQELKKYLYNSDILVLPYTNKHYQSTTTSPIKLFEYLATGVPVLSSNIKGINSWVSEKEITFYEPDNILDFINKINYIKNNKEVIENKCKKGVKLSKKYSIKNRTKEILNYNFINSFNNFSA